MSMALILSIPYWLLLSFDTSSPSNSSVMLWLPSPLLILVVIQLTISLFVLTSQMPSQPIIIKSMFLFSVLVMSGHGLIICSSGLSLSPVLYSRSPRARERLSPPFTRPKLTVPPAFLILSNSIESSGLWSLLNSLVSPLIEATDLESPALAQ